MNKPGYTLGPNGQTQRANELMVEMRALLVRHRANMYVGVMELTFDDDSWVVQVVDVAMGTMQNKEES